MKVTTYQDGIYYTDEEDRPAHLCPTLGQLRFCLFERKKYAFLKKAIS